MPEKPDFMKGIFIPPQPRIIEDVREASPDLQKIAELIGKDAAISANVIKLVNSSKFNLPNKITSIRQAVVMAGLDQVVNIMNGILIRMSYEKFDESAYIDFWRLNEELALASAAVAMKLELAFPDDAYLFGLLSLCGIPAMTEKFDQYNHMLKLAWSQGEVSIPVFIDNLIHTNHATVGYYVAKTWNIPDRICKALAISRDPIRDHTKGPNVGLLASLRIAEYICHASLRLTSVEEDYFWLHDKYEILEYLYIDEAEFNDFIKDIKDKIFNTD